jgi:tRNA A-37 threonylcarbamoyl transferase component Bud32
VLACPTCHSQYDPVGARYCSHCGTDIRPAGADDGADAWIGKIIDGRYRVQARVGTGGMGAVYRVEHVRMGKVAAMKVLHRELAKEDQITKRFRREVEVVAHLNHPNIVQTFDFGTHDGLMYLIMEYVRGEDLGAIVKRDGPLAATRAMALGMQICSALDEAHNLGVVHRDLKPENVVCVRRRDEEHAKVLDFGLAKLRERPDLGEITGAGNLIGTPYYMSPEQVRSENVDHRTDIYSLGAMLYRVITGEFPFEGNSPMGIMSKHLTDDVIPPSERVPELRLSPEVDRIVLRAMARNPAHRYASAGEMRRELEAMIGLASGDRARGNRSMAGGAAESLVEGEGSEPLGKLEREDFDAFERREKVRRRVASFVVAPMLLLGLVLAGWAIVRFLRPRPSTFEKEPNDIAAMATLLPRDRPVSGHVGEPRPSGEPDFDYYRIPAAKSGVRAVTAKITGVPDIDLVLELYDGAGKLVMKVDHARAGEGESLGPVAIGPGEAFVRARPVWAAGETPAPGSTTPYELTVDWAKPRPDWELEPNDTPALANKIDKESAVSGYLAAPDDQDWFVVKVPPGMRLDGRVDGIDGIDLVVLLGEERKRIDTAGAGEHEPFTALARDGNVLIGISEQPVKRSGKKAPPPADRDEPYTLKLKFRPEDPPGR